MGVACSLFLSKFADSLGSGSGSNSQVEFSLSDHLLRQVHLAESLKLRVGSILDWHGDWARLADIAQSVAEGAFLQLELVLEVLVPLRG